MGDERWVRDLGDGLAVRWTTAVDSEQVGELAASVFRQSAEAPLNLRQAAWTRDMASGRHPLGRPDGGLVVEDRNTRRIVASLWLLPTVWTYGGTSFNIGRPEQVISDPAYRRRGLVRALFDAFHAHSSAAGELVQAITGIFYFYRQFGYEYAVDLDGSRRVAFMDIPNLKEGETDPYHLRRATREELPFARALYERDRRNSLVSAEMPLAYWEWMHLDVSEESGEGCPVLLIVDATDTPRGYVVVRARRWSTQLPIRGIAVEGGLSLASVIRPVLRGLRDVARNTPPVREPVEADHLMFYVGAQHPVYEAIGNALASWQDPPYAWYVRVADLSSFIRHIAPALERRLPGTAADGYTGELLLDFHRDGLRLVLEHGRLHMAEPWQRPVWGPGASGSFPPLVFLQLLFGRRSLAELRYAYPDVWASAEATPILEALFPSAHSHVITLD